MLTRHALTHLCRARDLLRETPERSPRIGEVARAAAMSRFHFIRQFQAVFGDTPHQFRLNARIDRAKRLLALTDASVTNVCLDVGYSSLGSFSAFFTRRVGAAPSRYRRQVRSTVTTTDALHLEMTPGCRNRPAWARRRSPFAPTPAAT